MCDSGVILSYIGLTKDDFVRFRHVAIECRDCGEEEDYNCEDDFVCYCNHDCDDYYPQCVDFDGICAFPKGENGECEKYNGCQSFVVSVSTRLGGGGNREEYRETIKKLQGHYLYIKDYNDSYDRSYATFVFELPHVYGKCPCKKCVKGVDFTKWKNQK